MVEVSLWAKLRQFWHSSLLNKSHSISTAYYRLKGVALYRFTFNSFGKGSWIRRPLLILNPEYISIGSRVSIRDGARLEVIRSKGARIPSLLIGDDTNIEQNVHIVCHSRVHIGKGVSITGNCCIVDVTHPFRDAPSLGKIGARIADEDSFVEIGDGAFIGFGSVILPNVRIGRGAVVGANSVVASDMADYSVCAGSPARVIETYSQSPQN